MNREIDELIPQAIKAIEKNLVIDGKVVKEYKGYIPSMGASILQSGLIATLAFYSKDVEGSRAKRTKLLAAIYSIINQNPKQGQTLLQYVMEKIKGDDNTTFKLSDLNQKELKELEKQILNALVALKLALRTFDIEQ